MRALLRVLTCALALPASADLLVVDDDGGPCADFTQITAAVQAAADGDVIVVYPGVYNAFAIDDRRLTVVGIGNDPVFVGAGVKVRYTAVGRNVVLSGIETSTLLVRDCLGTVQLRDVVLVEKKVTGTTSGTPGFLRVTGSSDVRVHGLEIDAAAFEREPDGVHVDSSRVELLSAYVAAPKGMPGSAVPPENGGHALAAVSGSRVHVSLSTLLGGLGARQWSNNGSGDGGHGIEADGEVLVTGRAIDVLQGGDGGPFTTSSQADGGDGASLTGVAPSLRWSAATFAGGVGVGTGSDGLPIDAPAGTVTQAAPADPSLELVDAASHVVRVWGDPGAPVTLLLGRTPILDDDGAALVPRLVNPLRTIDLGTVPASGFVDAPLTVLAYQAGGTPFWAQAELAYPGADLRRTNSVSLVVPPPVGPDDCDANGIDDSCDIAAGGDCDGNGVVDACEVPVETNSLVAPLVTSSYDLAVDLDGSTLVVGSARDGGDWQGAVWVYGPSGSGWALEQTLSGIPGSKARFGADVTAEGDLLVVGAPGEDDPVNGTEAGAVYVHRRVGTTWTQEARLTLFNGFPNDYLGARVALSGSTVLATAGLDLPGVAKGGIVVFEGAGPVWTQTQVLIAPAGSSGTFGTSVAIDGDVAVVGSPWISGPGIGDAALVYERTGSSWSYSTALTVDAPLAFGWSVAVRGDVALVGDVGNYPYSPGSVYVFREVAGAWIEEAALAACDPSPVERFGHSVALESGRAIVGTNLTNVTSLYTGGAAHVFEYDGSAWLGRGALRASGGYPGDVFGEAVAVDGGRVLVGAPDAAAAYLFEDP